MFNGLLAGTAAYRPPPVAYALAMQPRTPFLHRFHHGTRPRLPTSADTAEAGLEIYYRSPSFLITAGGSFLNSGYGHDELTIPFTKKFAWEQSSRAQATTLIPTRAYPAFGDLIRFQPFLDPTIDPYAKDRDHPEMFHTVSVNTAVHRGLMAGANLRPGDRSQVAGQTTKHAPALALHLPPPAQPDQPAVPVLMTAWKGSGNSALNTARVQTTSLFGLDGVEGIRDLSCAKTLRVV